MIDLRELVNRPVIRNDQPHEWLNKMTDDEIAAYKNNLPANGAEATAKMVDRDILYTIFKDAK